MAEREEELARASEGLRARRSPPPAAEARVLAGLETMLGPLGGGGAGLVASGGTPAGQTIWWVKIVGATLGLTGASLVALRALVVLAGLEGAPTQREPTPRAAEARAAEARAAEARAAEARVETPHAPTPVAPATPREPTNEPPERVGVAVSQPASEPASHDDASEPLDADALAGELALMRTIRGESDALARLALLAEHERDYPRGHMADERRALQAIAACELGRISEAREGLERLREARPSSPLLDRVTAACPGL
jgi:hypothetical protein